MKTKCINSEMHSRPNENCATNFIASPLYSPVGSVPSLSYKFKVLCRNIDGSTFSPRFCAFISPIIVYSFILMRFSAAPAFNISVHNGTSHLHNHMQIVVAIAVRGHFITCYFAFALKIL